MKNFIRQYTNDNWHEYANFIKNRDNWQCTNCHKTNSDATLQVHHTCYKPGNKPWEYPYSDCITLCKGCHALEHGKIEPNSGWTLVSIEDRGEPTGRCERVGCGKAIRFEHNAYHPKVGHKSFGSTCINHLTEEDQSKSEVARNLFGKISMFIRNSKWYTEVSTKAKVKYKYSEYMHHRIHVYTNSNYYGIQVGIKHVGVRKFDFHQDKKAKPKSFENAKELAFVLLLGLISEDEKEKEFLRHIYSKYRVK